MITWKMGQEQKTALLNSTLEETWLLYSTLEEKGIQNTSFEFYDTLNVTLSMWGLGYIMKTRVALGQVNQCDCIQPCTLGRGFASPYFSWVVAIANIIGES